MNSTLLPLSGILLLSGCCQVPPPPSATWRSPAVVEPSPPIKTSPLIHEYKVAAYIDPNNPNVVHQAHRLYAEERSPSWNLQSPLVQAGISRGPSNAPADSALAPQRTRDELFSELAEQRKLSKTLQEQSERLLLALQKIAPQTEQGRRLQEEQEQIRRLLEQVSSRLAALERAVPSNPTPSTQKTNVW